MKNTKETTLTYQSQDYVLNPPDASELTYVIISDDVIIDSKTCTTYGIGVMHHEKMIARVPDISFDLEKIESLVKDCNTCNLSLIHLYDIAEDAAI